MDFVAAHPVAAGLAAVFIGVPLLVVAYFTVLHSRREKNAPPVWTGGYPLIGQFHKFGASPVEAIKEGYEKNGPVFTMKFLNFNMTFLIGPKAQAPFYDPVNDDDTLSQNEPYAFMTPVFGKGIVFDAPVERKRQQLRFVGKSLKGAPLRGYVPKIIKEMDAYLDETWGNAGEIDLLDAMAHVIILTASKCLLGDEVRAQLFGGISELLRKLDEGINPISIFFPNAPLPSFRVRDQARAEIGEIFGKIIRERRASQAGGAPPKEDMLQWLMDAEYEDGTRPTDDHVTGLLLAALFAGQHTSSITSTWTILNLLHHPHFYGKVMQEQIRVMGANPLTTSETLVFDTVQQMDELHRAMKESLRMNPPLIMLMRAVKKPIKVLDYTVPVGHFVFTSPAVTMNLTKGADAIFSKADSFDPDRYAEGREEDKKAMFGYSAFGGGTHACVGEAFGFMQVKTIVALVLRKFELMPLDPLPKQDYTAMVSGPLKPCRVRYRRRTGPITADFPKL